jgi:hypothetical protein
MIPETLTVTLMLTATLAGGAPAHLGRALVHRADRYHVRDAAARASHGYWNLRFNEPLLSDLDDAMASGKTGDQAGMRRRAEQVIRAADSYALESASGEIDRLPEKGRLSLAKRYNCEPTLEAMKAAYAREAQAALAREIRDVKTLEPAKLLSRLKDIRKSVERAIDDRGRLLRQLTLSWAALPSWSGLKGVEVRYEKARAQRASKAQKNAVICPLRDGSPDDLEHRYAPTLALEWPPQRKYPADYDRFGAVFLTGDPAHIKVNIDTSHPRLYTYRSQAKINSKRYPQFVYVWWYSHQPEMEDNDPTAGRIDGGTLRITLDSHDRPAVFEAMRNCGCGHTIFVSKALEDAARQEFQRPEPNKKLCIERHVNGKRDLDVLGTVNVPDGPVRPVVRILAGYHEIYRIDVAGSEQGKGVGFILPERPEGCCAQNEPDPFSAQGDLNVIETHEYDTAPYETLQHLPLNFGFASMFGSDGLVHDAGRKEGYLLAPTGMLSAGQPRQRGTQKIRWDDFTFDDPHLLEKTLRFPRDF